jgi:hypothetical protein
MSDREDHRRALVEALKAKGMDVNEDTLALLPALERIEALIGEGLTQDEALGQAVDAMWPDDDPEQPILEDDKGRIVIEEHEDGSYVVSSEAGLVWIHPDGTETKL